MEAEKRKFPDLPDPMEMAPSFKQRVPTGAYGPVAIDQSWLYAALEDEDVMERIRRALPALTDLEAEAVRKVTMEIFEEIVGWHLLLSDACFCIEEGDTEQAIEDLESAREVEIELCGSSLLTDAFRPQIM